MVVLRWYWPTHEFWTCRARLMNSLYPKVCEARVGLKVASFAKRESPNNYLMAVPGSVLEDAPACRRVWVEPLGQPRQMRQTSLVQKGSEGNIAFSKCQDSAWIYKGLDLRPCENPQWDGNRQPISVTFHGLQAASHRRKPEMPESVGDMWYPFAIWFVFSYVPVPWDFTIFIWTHVSFLSNSVKNMFMPDDGTNWLIDCCLFQGMGRPPTSNQFRQRMSCSPIWPDQKWPRVKIVMEWEMRVIDH